ncbi:hypothetical protein [Bdellovibrio svalbardensis]|uniref:Outer membrane protein beta-barrel domain-containing protein n=1 Tax=Bdellovibrio svalbardensis TaxID=2972972 RepID=A0ABT6DGV0_9BACT|nr:hypothetical protein [Bdellovibrio svalbardensis]MDG0816060.1 hypothetical protein [Bdellovibrio svalbardensis]
MKKIIALSLLASSVLTLGALPAFAEEQVSNEVPVSSDAGTAAAETPETETPAEGKTAISTPTRKKSVSSITTSAIGLSTLQWNEALLLKQAGKSENDVANYSGLALSYQRETIYYRWGWNFGGFIGTGRANGGGNVSTIPYQKDKQPFTIIGLSPRVFYRLTGRVNVGLTGMAYVRNVEWPSETAGLTVDATRNFTLTALADANLRISDKLDFYQGIGPLDKGATFWRIGLAYRIQ